MTPDPMPTGIHAVDTSVAWAVAAVALATAFALLVRVLRAVRRMAQQMENFNEDWHGDPGRPGIPRRAGVMERLCGIESRLAAVEAKFGDTPPPSGRAIRVVP